MSRRIVSTLLEIQLFVGSSDFSSMPSWVFQPFLRFNLLSTPAWVLERAEAVSTLLEIQRLMCLVVVGF